MRKLRVAVAMHSDLLPPKSIEGLSPDEVNRFKMEYDVLTTLNTMGHEAVALGIENDFRPLERSLKEFKPHVVFNLLAHFHNAAIYESAVVSWMELHKQAYTGCNPRGIFVANDKALSKKVLSYHRIRAARFMAVPRGKTIKQLPKRLAFPLFVKSASEHASTGIAQASIVRDLEHLRERVEFIHRNVGTAALCEEYIEGRELTVGVLGNQRLEVGPVWEMDLEGLPEGAPRIVTSRLKWDLDYQKQVGLKTGPADLPAEKIAEIQKLGRRIYRALGLSGFARIDMRMDESGKIWILEANPNPDLCFGEDFAESFETLGYSYPALLQKLLNLGTRYHAPWMG
ncbi:MAG: D-alanine--D-alanine ligase [Planctomycetota bacterium]|jgi:D-alanine-D-alanine ligase|nr:D-alanine--D-alanine ligase [Planctomycetota bacterium]